MCGIAGIFAYGDAAPPVDEAELLRTRERMAKRGPDGAGLWISPLRRVGLAHRRLAIIDLSETGAQPMATADGRFTITFNGEIYNYRELRRGLEAKGCVFRTQSDTEVLLHLYADLGAQMVHRLRGMFAFAIWDARERTMFLARDPFGIKPLYYADDGGTLRFASQVKALLAGGAIDPVPQPAGSVGFLIWGCVPEPFTLYRHIKALPAGATLTVMKGSVREPAVYFSVREELVRAQNEAIPFRAQDHVALGAALLDTVQHHMVADVPVGVFLSAGIDSTLIASLAVQQDHAALRTLTLGFSEYRGRADDEVPWAERTAAALCTQHETQWISSDDFDLEREAILEAMDQPTTDGVNTYFVCRAAQRAGIKVALSGLGGDELFGGYPSFAEVPRLAKWLPSGRGARLLGRFARGTVRPLLRRFTSPKYAGLLEYGGTYAGAYLLRRALFMPWELDEVLEPSSVRAGLAQLQTIPCLARSIDGVRRPHARVAALELSWYMRNQLLRDADWAGMAHSVEVRVPLVDAVVFRTLAPLLASREAPDKADAVAASGVAMGRRVLERPKTGFSVPVRDWIASRAGEHALKERGLRGWAMTVLRKFQPAENPGRGPASSFSFPRAMAARGLYLAANATLRALARVLWPGGPPTDARRVCISRIGNIGDIVCALPAMRAVRRAFPGAKLTFMSSPGEQGRPGASDVLEGVDWIDATLVYHKHDIDALGKRWALLKTLRARQFDVWIELPNNLSAVRRQIRDLIFTWLAGVRWARGWNVDTIHWAAPAQSEHLAFQNEVERMLGIVRASGIPAGEADFGLPRRPATVAAVSARLAQPGISALPMVALAPGAKRATNLWPAQRFAEVGRYLARAGKSVLILGGASDAVECSALAAAIGPAAHSVAGVFSLEESCELLRRCEVLVCLDSGLQHLAAAVGTPCVSLFSCWQMRGKWRPHGERNVVLQKWVDCHTCMLERCPRDNYCMKEIAVADVTAALATRFGLRAPGSVRSPLRRPEGDPAIRSSSSPVDA